MGKRKLKKNEAIKELRRIIRRTQPEFAAMVGCSVDAVASWEGGRNPLSKALAQRIFAVTGADYESLLQGKHVLTRSGAKYTVEVFDDWRRGGSELHKHLARGVHDTLGLLLAAASKPGPSKVKDRFSGVLASFIGWADEMRTRFNLKSEIDALLRNRKFVALVRTTYGTQRKYARSGKPTNWHNSFKDDPRKKNTDELTIPYEFVPLWKPGKVMGPPATRGTANDAVNAWLSNFNTLGIKCVSGGAALQVGDELSYTVPQRAVNQLPEKQPARS